MIAIITSLFLITVINVLAYVWAYKKQSDHLTDISYSLCFIFVIAYFFISFGRYTTARIVLSFMIILWGLRLGGFLFYRIKKMGRDRRFDDFRESKVGFLKFWILQSISIWIIVLPALFGLLDDRLTINPYAISIWTLGWVLQTITDWQKFTFKQSNPESAFVDTGIFKWIRHPNYTGEIMVWVGIFWYVMDTLEGIEWLSIISPLWIITLLVFVSGIPLIEYKNKKKYQTDVAYKKYFDSSWRLIPYIY